MLIRLSNKVDYQAAVKQKWQRKDLAEAGGKNPEKLDESLEAVPRIIEQML